ncbi:MAG: ABC transporter ATP-binding protein [Bdellovibrionia bacterium]
MIPDPVTPDLIAKVKNLSKTYFQAGLPIQVLKGLDFQIMKGETVAVVGQSGSGKSTFLSLLAGLDRPTQGTVELAGQDIFLLNETKLAKFRSRNLGIIFQQFHLMSYLSALQNISLPLEIARIPGAESLAAEALKQVGLEHRINHLPQQLSGGEKQRVAIARAFIIRPKLLLADEPSGSLDPKTGEEVLEILFEQVKSSHMSMILVTHNESLAKKCDRQLCLEDGKLK